MSNNEQGCGLYVPEDPNITAFSTGHEVQRLTYTDGFIIVEDPWLGDEVVTNPVLNDFYRTPSFMRSLGLAQLLKSKESSTIPNVASFSRGWGLIAQYPLVERFGKMQGLSAEHILAIHLACEGDDQAHFAFSHKLEFATQKWGGPENEHEQNWPMIAALGGVTKALDKHNVQYDEKMHVPGFKIPKWASADTREDIDVDRLQFIAAEGLLWFDNEYVPTEIREKVRDALNPANFVITPDGELAFKNPYQALVVAKLLQLFASEHYNDPLARAQLHLDVHGVQRTISTRRMPWMNSIDQGLTRKAKNYFFAIDQDFTDALRTGPGRADGFIYLASNTLNQSGMEERRRFLDYRLRAYAEFLFDDQAESYPSEYLEPKRVDFGPRSSTLHTEVVKLTEQERAELDQVKIPRLEDTNSNALTYLAGPLKNRYIDPLVQQNGTFVRLSEIKGLPYAKLMAEHQYLQTLGVRVSFAFTPEYAREFKEGMRQNDDAFRRILEGTDMTPDQLRKLIEGGGRRAMELQQRAGALVLKTEIKI